jgi:tellurite resistance protein TerC
MFADQLPLWGGFTLFILAMLALDLGVFQRKPHVISVREALAWFAVWAGLAILFNIGILVFHPRAGEAGLEFLTGFLIEKSLSVDNIFVFILIFNYFHVPAAYHHKVLFWGIVGAIVLRTMFIVGGLALMERFHWTIYAFGTFLLASGIGMMLSKESKVDPEKNWVIRNFRRVFPVTTRYDGNRFFTRQNARLVATPLFIVVLAIESSDIIFAADSIPAIFAITSDPFIVYTSNIFAMLGLRSLYFAVTGFMQTFWFLHYGFASIIIILGIKMLLSDVYTLPIAVPLVLIVVILLVCVIVSLLRPRRADLKQLFKRTERLGLIPFRRLLLIENVIDLGDLAARDAMRQRSGVQAIQQDRPWSENLAMIRETHFSRYPLVANDGGKPLGIIHIKDLIPGHAAPLTADQLRRLARPVSEVREDAPLEEVLAQFQRRNQQMALIVNAGGEWMGIVTIEDVLEELVGKIGDEFDAARTDGSVSLADALSPARIVFVVQGASIADAARSIIAQIPRAELPADPETVLSRVLERERVMSTYLGHGLAVPHGRLDALAKPMLAFGRSDEGVPVQDRDERAHLLFLLLTPTGMPRIQPRMLADIVGLLESEYVTERLQKAQTPAEVIEAVRAGQQIAVD